MRKLKSLRRSMVRILATYFVWILTGIAVLLGLLLLSLGSQIEHGVLGELTSHIGIAFLVASIIAAIYELHARTRFDLERMSGILDATMRSIVPPEVWEELKRDVIHRSVIRRDAYIRLKLLRNEGLPGNQAILWMQLGYSLYGLKAGLNEVIVEHELDYYMQIPDRNLPRFERVIVGTDVYEGNQRLSEIVKNGILRVNVDVDTRHPVQIVAERFELTYVPGLYTFSTAEIMQGLTVHFDELPDGVVPSVRIRLHREQAAVRAAGRIWYYDGIILPGQTVEILTALADQ